MPELRIAPDRARAADLGVSVEEVATTINALVGGVRVGKYSSAGGASTSACGCSPRSARGPRTSRGSRCAPRPASWSRCRRWSHTRSGRRCRRSPGATASARSPSSATSRPATRRSEALATVEQLGGQTCRPATALVLGGASVDLPRVDGQPALRARARHRRRVHGAGLAVQLVPAPDHGAHDPAAVGRRRGRSRSRSPARRSTSSA